MTTRIPRKKLTKYQYQLDTLEKQEKLRELLTLQNNVRDFTPKEISDIIDDYKRLSKLNDTELGKHEKLFEDQYYDSRVADARRKYTFNSTRTPHQIEESRRINAVHKLQDFYNIPGNYYREPLDDDRKKELETELDKLRAKLESDIEVARDELSVYKLKEPSTRRGFAVRPRLLNIHDFENEYYGRELGDCIFYEMTEDMLKNIHTADDLKKNLYNRSFINADDTAFFNDFRESITLYCFHEQKGTGDRRSRLIKLTGEIDINKLIGDDAGNFTYIYFIVDNSKVGRTDVVLGTKYRLKEAGRSLAAAIRAVPSALAAVPMPRMRPMPTIAPPYRSSRMRLKEKKKKCRCKACKKSRSK